MKRRKKITGQSLAIQYFFKMHGGWAECGRKLKMDPQVVYNWGLRGRVPLKYCGLVSKLFGGPRAIFNYEDYILFQVNVVLKYYTWEEIVKDCKFPENVQKKILAAKAPKTLEEIYKKYE